MKAMILAAGRGERMGKLSQTKPKPLQELDSKPLIAYQIERLAKAGVKELLINVSYLGEKIIEVVGDGERYGVAITYSNEPEVLGTAGGVINVLDFFEEQSFILTSSDIWHDFDFATLPSLTSNLLAHLVMVENPEHNADGDYCLLDSGKLALGTENRKTYAGIGVFSPKLFHNLPVSYRTIGSLIEGAIDTAQVTAELHTGNWRNIDTPEILAEINQKIAV